MKIPLYQVDAFTDRLFGGNPAAICPLEEWLPDGTLQAIAAENNLAETAFFVEEDDVFHLRWFTPLQEVDLCGHATLASAYVIANHFGRETETVRFRSKSGPLVVSREGELYALDFPSRPPQRTEPVLKLMEALGAESEELWRSRDLMAVFKSEQRVRALNPDMAKLAGVDAFALIVTAPGTDCDFVSRFFAPARGIPEDPVTGSAHCTLIPYWAQRLGKSTLHARQVSARGGELFCEDRGERVKIAGRAVLYATGMIHLP
jgi:PhzF family phenazine biosynthesis protein